MGQKKGYIKKIREEIINILPGSTITTIKKENYINSFFENVEIGNQIVPVGTIDPTNVSSLDANMIDGNYATYIYNNASPGSANKELPAMDLGSVLNVSFVRIKWYPSPVYELTNFKIQASNDGILWVDIAVNLNSLGKNGLFQDFEVTGSYQYWRIFSVQSNNATWVLIQEMEVFAPGIIYFKEVGDGSSLIIRENGQFIEINNNYSVAKNIKIKYHV